MKAILPIRTLVLATVTVLIFATAGLAQTDKTKGAKTKGGNKGNSAEQTIPLPAPSSESDSTPADATADDGGKEDEILPYYANYLKEYRLGPSDIISVEVFGQCPDYCKTNISVPPNARISYPLIREGILVAGRTVEQVAAEITKKLDEFIIDPKVTVTLDKAMATRYAVMGNVAAPGVRVLDRKVSVYEAILESGGLTRNGDANKVFVVSYTKDGRLSRKLVSLAAMESGHADMVYLSPGDQVFVGGKGFTIQKFLAVLGMATSARGLFY